MMQFVLFWKDRANQYSTNCKAARHWAPDKPGTPTRFALTLKLVRENRAESGETLHLRGSRSQKVRIQRHSRRCVVRQILFTGNSFPRPRVRASKTLLPIIRLTGILRGASTATPAIASESPRTGLSRHLRFVVRCRPPILLRATYSTLLSTNGMGWPWAGRPA
jgi:hypothetical protein